MPLYEITNNSFRTIPDASLADLKLRERGDLQRLLRTQIEVLGDDLYVLTEEFGEWEDTAMTKLETALKPALDSLKM